MVENYEAIHEGEEIFIFGLVPGFLTVIEPHSSIRIFRKKCNKMEVQT